MAKQRKRRSHYLAFHMKEGLKWRCVDPRVTSSYEEYQELQEVSYPWRIDDDLVIEDKEFLTEKISVEEAQLYMEGPYQCSSCYGLVWFDSRAVRNTHESNQCPYCWEGGGYLPEIKGQPRESVEDKVARLFSEGYRLWGYDNQDEDRLPYYEFHVDEDCFSDVNPRYAGLTELQMLEVHAMLEAGELVFVESKKDRKEVVMA